jgi:hypothetical protein
MPLSGKQRLPWVPLNDALPFSRHVMRMSIWKKPKLLFAGIV